MRIIASALPVLRTLATGETGLMLAPKADDFEDEREIWDIDKIIKQKAVLYMGLDSLSNNIPVASGASRLSLESRARFQRTIASMPFRQSRLQTHTSAPGHLRARVNP